MKTSWTDAGPASTVVRIDPDDQPLRVVIDDYLDTVAAAPRSVSAYRHDLEVGADILESLLGRPPLLSDVTAPTLRAMFEAYLQTHAIPSTTRARSSWNKLCLALTWQELLPDNPMGVVPSMSQPRRTPPVLTDEQLAGLLHTLSCTRPTRPTQWPIRDHALIAMEIACGLRPSEAVTLNVEDIIGHPDSRAVRVAGVGAVQSRELQIPAEVDLLLESYLLDRWNRYPDPEPARDTPWKAPPGTPLWISVTGNRLTPAQMNSLVAVALKLAAIPGAATMSTYTLRATLAAKLLDHAVHFQQVTDFLGLASASTLNVLAPPPPTIEELFETLGRVLD